MPSSRLQREARDMEGVDAQTCFVPLDRTPRTHPHPTPPRHLPPLLLQELGFSPRPEEPRLCVLSRRAQPPSKGATSYAWLFKYQLVDIKPHPNPLISPRAAFQMGHYLRAAGGCRSDSAENTLTLCILQESSREI